MSQANLSDLENDKYPSSSYTAQLAYELGVSGVWLAENRGPGPTSQTLTQMGLRGIGHVGEQIKTYDVDPAVHDGAPVQTERLMAGDIPEHEFTWIAEDDEMAGGDRPVLRGYRVVIEPRAVPEPGMVALIQIGDRRPVLREIKDNGAFWYIAGKGNLEPVRLVDGEYRIIGLMVTAHFERIPVKLKKKTKKGGDS